MDRYLLTHSLLSSWLYALKDNPYEDLTAQRDPLAEFVSTLNRVETPPTEAILNGITFEDLATAIICGAPQFRYREMNDKTKEIRNFCI